MIILRVNIWPLKGWNELGHHMAFLRGFVQNKFDLQIFIQDCWVDKFFDLRLTYEFCVQVSNILLLLFVHRCQKRWVIGREWRIHKWCFFDCFIIEIFLQHIIFYTFTKNVIVKIRSKWDSALFISDIYYLYLSPD